MKFRYRVVNLLIAASAASFATGLRADEAAALTTEIQAVDANATSRGQGVVTGKIASDFEPWAGSRANATSLVTGLRNGSPITLTEPGKPSAMFTPPTRPLGYGNVSTSLALAKFQLAQQGITNPTPSQIQTALTGGTITANGKMVDYQGILRMRADGLGWGQIAHASGTKLGPVVSGIHSQNQHFASLPPAPKPVTTMPNASSSGATSVAASRAGAQSASASRGVVTAAGTAPGAAQGKGQGKAATAGGEAAPRGQGIVTAAGNSASPAAIGASGAKGGGVVTAEGSSAAASSNAGGNGKALGRSK